MFAAVDEVYTVMVHHVFYSGKKKGPDFFDSLESISLGPRRARSVSVKERICEIKQRSGKNQFKTKMKMLDDRSHQLTSMV